MTLTKVTRFPKRYHRNMTKTTSCSQFFWKKSPNHDHDYKSLPDFYITFNMMPRVRNWRTHQIMTTAPNHLHSLLHETQQGIQIPTRNPQTTTTSTNRYQISPRQSTWYPHLVEKIKIKVKELTTPFPHKTQQSIKILNIPPQTPNPTPIPKSNTTTANPKP